MILDDLVALFAGIVEILLTPVLWAVDLVMAGTEIILNLFITGISLPRVSRRTSESDDSIKRRNTSSQWKAALFIAAIVGLLCLVPLLLERQVSFVAADEHAVPFAEVVIEKGEERIHKRTDSVGNVSIPRFGVSGVTIKSARYVEQTWRGDEIQGRLVVQRTLLGSGIDKVARALLAPAEK